MRASGSAAFCTAIKASTSFCDLGLGALACPRTTAVVNRAAMNAVYMLFILSSLEKCVLEAVLAALLPVEGFLQAFLSGVPGLFGGTVNLQRGCVILGGLFPLALRIGQAP